MNLALKIIMLGIMTVSGTFGALFFKKGITRMKGLNILTLINIPEIYIGVTFYLLGAAFNIILLEHIPYTVLYPMTSLTYIWTMIVSYIVLKEKINNDKVIAITFITVGVFVLSLSR